MKRVSVTVPVPEGQTPEFRKGAMHELAFHMGELHPGVSVESVGPLFIVASVPEKVIGLLRDLGCQVNDEPPAKLTPER